MSKRIVTLSILIFDEHPSATQTENLQKESGPPQVMPRTHTSDQASPSPNATTSSWKGVDAVSGRDTMRPLPIQTAPSLQPVPGRATSFWHLCGFGRNKCTGSWGSANPFVDI